MKIGAEPRREGCKTTKDQKAYNAAYYVAHREEKRARRAAYRVAHPEKQRARSMAYYVTHREEKIAYSRTYRATHREEIQKRKATYYVMHRDAKRTYGKVYRATHREEIRAYTMAHREEIRAYIMTRRPRDFSRKTDCDLEEVKLWFDKDDRTCWLCGKPGATDLDHDHDTKRIRGWTHRGCNMVEGLVLSSPDPRCLLATLLCSVKRW